MAIVIKRDTSGKKCWMCGREIEGNEASIVSTGARDILYMHSYCEYRPIEGESRGLPFGSFFVLLGVYYRTGGDTMT